MLGTPRVAGDGISDVVAKEPVGSARLQRHDVGAVNAARQ